jgi:hypothetical protein
MTPRWNFIWRDREGVIHTRQIRSHDFEGAAELALYVDIGVHAEPLALVRVGWQKDVAELRQEGMPWQ